MTSNQPPRPRPAQAQPAEPTQQIPVVPQQPIAPPPRNGGGGQNAAIIVLVVLIVAALAGVGYLLYDRNKTDDAAAAAPSSSAPASAASSAAPASTSAAAITGKTVTHSSGTFTVTLPNTDWQVQSDQTSKLIDGAPIIRSAPNMDSYLKVESAGYGITDLTGNQITPDEVLDKGRANANGGCKYSDTQPFSYKGFSGSFMTLSPCTYANGFVNKLDNTLVAVEGPDNTKFLLGIYDNSGETSSRDAALQTLESAKHSA